MGLVLEYDARNNVLRGTLEGVVTNATLLDSYEAAARYAALHPPCRGIWHLSGVTDFDVSSDTIRQIVAMVPIIPPGYMRVVVAQQDLPFGMMRMLQMLSEKARPELQVVRTMDEAYHLLCIESPEFVAAS